MSNDLQKEVEKLRELAKLMSLGTWRTVFLHNPPESKRPSPESVTAFFPANADMIRELLDEISETPPTPATYLNPRSHDPEERSKPPEDGL